MEKILKLDIILFVIAFISGLVLLQNDPLGLANTSKALLYFIGVLPVFAWYVYKTLK